MEKTFFVSVFHFILFDRLLCWEKVEELKDCSHAPPAWFIVAAVSHTGVHLCSASHKRKEKILSSRDENTLDPDSNEANR